MKINERKTCWKLTKWKTYIQLAIPLEYSLNSFSVLALNLNSFGQFSPWHWNIIVQFDFPVYLLLHTKRHFEKSKVFSFDQKKSHETFFYEFLIRRINYFVPFVVRKLKWHGFQYPILFIVSPAIRNRSRRILSDRS